MDKCDMQEVCESFTNGTKRRPHNIRLNDVCTYFEDGCKLDLPTGAYCNIEKIQRIKKELKEGKCTGLK